jgi:hypothetical protein
VEKRLFQLVMQDEARHVSYGLQHLKYLIDNVPDCRSQVNRFLDEAELHLAGLFNADQLESMIVLAGKGTDKKCIERGLECMGAFQNKQVEEYLHRCERAGMPERRERSPLSKLRDMMLSARSPAA